MAPLIAHVPFEHGMSSSAVWDEHTDQVLVFSVLLRAILFIAYDGELRIRSPCVADAADPVPDQTLLKYCQHQGVGDEHHCYYASPSKGHALAMKASDGMLTTITMPAEMPQDVNEHGLCLLFRETRRGNDVTIRSACRSMTSSRALAFAGRPFPSAASCSENVGPFSQVPADSGTKFEEMRMSHHAGLLLEPGFALLPLPCQRAKYQEVMETCPGHLRYSYPLLWNPLPCRDSKTPASPTTGPPVADS